VTLCIGSNARSESDITVDSGGGGGHIGETNGRIVWYEPMRLCGACVFVIVEGFCANNMAKGINETK
jgi:hypothetical protein